MSFRPLTWTSINEGNVDEDHVSHVPIKFHEVYEDVNKDMRSVTSGLKVRHRNYEFQLNRKHTYLNYLSMVMEHLK